MICKVCGKELRISVRKNVKGIDYKSCPECSGAHGSEHIFYNDTQFGFTDKRKTAKNPDGIQSHCTECRGRGVNRGAFLKCSQLK